jgi:hypothetical protein
MLRYLHAGMTALTCAAAGLLPEHDGDDVLRELTSLQGPSPQTTE